MKWDALVILLLLVGVLDVSKAQVSVEQLISYASLMALFIPIIFLFLTLNSINQKELDYNSLDSSLSELALTVEKVYSLCSEVDMSPTPIKIKRVLSLRFPDDIDELKLVDVPSQDTAFLSVKLSDGTEILKRVNVPAGKVVYFNTFPSPPRGNRVIFVECWFESRSYNIEVGYND